ncbi:MAG: hypothetical protein ABGZ17_20860 [Planctomycetaceae bacterium]
MFRKVWPSMHRNAALFTIAAWSSIGLTHITVSTAVAQVMLQQPAMSNFSVNTTVSVPDRGGAYLGGLHRAGAGHKSFGPFRPGTATGVFRESQSLTSHVYIHDFQTMDRLLLETARRQAPDHSRRVTGRSAAAYGVLAARKPDRYKAGVLSNPRFRAVRGTPPSRKIPATKDRSAVASRALQLGRNALLRGRPSLARLHFQMAARYGSSEAATRLTDVERMLSQSTAPKR